MASPPRKDARGCFITTLVTSPLLSFIADMFLLALIDPRNPQRTLVLLSPWLISLIAILFWGWQSRRAELSTPAPPRRGWRKNFEFLQEHGADEPSPRNPEEIYLEDAKKLIYYNRNTAYYQKELRNLLLLDDEAKCRAVLELHLRFYTENYYEWDSDSGYEPQSARRTVEHQLRDLYSRASTPAWEKVLANPRKKIQGFPQPI